MRNSKKAITILGISTGIGAGAAIISVGTLLSLHDSFKVLPKQTYFFSELQKQVLKTENALKSVKEKNKTSPEIKQLASEVDFANQLLANENSSIALMIEQRNKLKQLTPKAMLSVTDDAIEVKNLINEYYSLVKDVDFQSTIKSAKDKVINSISSSESKSSALKNFYSVIDPLIERQNQFSFELETKIWTNHEQLVRNNSNLFSAQEKSALLSTIDQILNLLAQPEYSKDAVLEYEKVYDEMITKLRVNKTQENQNLNNFLKNVIRVRNEVNNLDIENSLKNNFLQRIEDYKNTALNASPTLAVTKAQEIEYLNTLVNNQLDTLIQETPDTDKLLQTLSQNLNNLKSISTNPKIQLLVQVQIDNILKNPKETPNDILNSIAQTSNLETSVKNISNLINTIQSNIKKYVDEKNLSQIDAQKFNTQLNDIVESKLNNVNEYLEKLNDLHNNIYDNVLLASVFKNSLSKLNNQILESQNKGRDVNKNVLARMSSQILSLLNGNVSVKELNDALRIQSNLLREINRKELKSWFDLSQAFLNGEGVISSDIRDRLEFLNSKAIELIPQDSTAIREELQNLIEQYRTEIEKANISDGLSNVLSKFKITKDDLFSIFDAKDGKIDSSFGQKLFEQAQELKKQAEITAQNPNLNAFQKEKRFNEIQQQLTNLTNNAQNFKDLEHSVALGEQTIFSSNGKRAEQAYLQAQALKINQVKADILSALNQASTANNVSDLVDQMNDAIKEYKEKQAEYQSGQALKDNFQRIKDVFAPYALNGVPTPVQKALTDKLTDYQNELSNTNLNSEQRAAINEKIANLMNVVESAKELEVRNNNLKTLIADTESADYGTFTPKQQFTKAKDLNQSTDQFINTLFKPDFDKDQINAHTQALSDESNQLSLAISVALLRKTNNEILKNKITNTNFKNVSPYNKINDSIDSINTQTENLIGDPQKTQAQIDNLESSIKKYLKLAQSLKASAEKLQNINQNDNPITYKALLDSIIDKPQGGTLNEPNNSLINFGDSVSVINFKTRILNDELSKSTTRLQAENNIKQLEMVYNTTNKNQAIFDDAITTFNAKIADYKIKLAEFYASASSLATLNDDIVFSKNREQAIRNGIQKEWDDAIALKTKLKNEYDQRKKADHLNSSTNTDAVFSQFDTLKEAQDANGKKTTLTKQLLSQLDLLPLAYTKDSFLQTAKELNNKFNAFNNYDQSIKTNYSDKWKTIITNWNTAIQNTVSNYNDSSDLVKIKRDYAKISSLSSLINQLQTIFDYLNTPSKSTPSEKNIQVLTTQHPNNSLFAKLNDTNAYTNADDHFFYTKTPDSIIGLRNEFRDLYFDTVSLEDAKASELNKIKNYKTEVDNKLTMLANIDSELKTQLDNKLNDLMNRTNAVTMKQALIDIDNELSSIQFKEENLKQLAIVTKRAKDLVTNKTKAAQSSTGKQSILTQITNIYNTYMSDYLAISPVDLIAKDRDLEDQISLFNKFEQVYQSVQNKKSSIPNTYPDGTGAHGTGQEAKTKMQAYYDHLTSLLDAGSVTQSKLFNVQNTLTSLDKLIALQNEKITTQNQVLSTTDYNNFEYKTGTNYNYGFENDAKKLADTILENIPTTSSTATEIDTTLYPNLLNSFSDVRDLYLARKNGLDLIYKSTAPDKGTKVKQVDQLNTQGTTTLDLQYQTLKTKADEFFHTQAQAIANATNRGEIDNAIINVVESDVFFEKYKHIAQLIKKANDAKNSMNSGSSTNIANDSNVQASLNKLQTEITKGEGYFYSEKSNANLDSNIFFLDTYTKRLQLAQQAAQELAKLNSFNSTPGNAEYLTNNAKNPLKNIINSIFTDLNNNPSLETEDNYNILKEKYLTGSSNNSYNIAFINSKILQANIYKAQTYLDKYNSQINNPNYEPQNIKDLYTQLQTKINEATSALENNTHNEEDKLRLASELYNSNSGILDLILKAETAKAKAVFAKNSELNKYLNSHYTNPNATPKENDYEQIALDAIKNIDIATADKLFTFNSTLTSAVEKYKEQRLLTFKWEANRYNSYKSKFEQFYNFLNASQTQGATKEFILKVTGITQDELNQFASAALLTASDTTHTNASTYAQKLNESDADIKTWLDTFTNNDVIEVLSNVASEFFDYYQNLISIKSIPSILLSISNLKRIDEQLIDDNSVENARFTLIQTNSITNDLTNRINNFLTEMNSITNNSSSDIRNENDESNIMFNQATTTAITTSRDTYFNTYKQIVLTLAKAKEKLEQIVFGTSDTDPNTLQKAIAKFIEGITGFDGRSQISNLLKFFASADQISPNLASNNDKFSDLKNEYAKISSLSVQSEHQVENLQKASSTDFDIYSAITNGFSTALSLFKWMANPDNTNLFFNYLFKTENGKLNYENITPKDSTSLETFDNLLNGNQITEQNISIDNTNFKAKKLNDQFDATGAGLIGNLFNTFNILKGSASIFNTSNVEVFVYKSTDPNAQYLRSRLTSDPSIKRGFVNLYFKFHKPAALTENTSAFGNVNEFGIKFENVGINFKTLDQFVISKANIQNTTTLQQTLFTAEQAGWNNVQAPSKFLGAFSKYSTVQALAQNLDYFTENVNEDINAAPSSTTNSSRNFRVKVKLTSAYKGYTQAGNTIFWKTLNPNLASDTGIEYQNNPNYWEGIVTQAQNTSLGWKNNYQYQYNSTTDAGKNLLFLPLVIGIPVFNTTNNNDAGLMVISWQILNRFDKNKTTSVQNISLGNSDVIRHVFFFKRTIAGKATGAPTEGLPQFYDYVMKKLKIRDVLAFTFDNLKPSKLWDADQYVQRDVAKSGKGGVGYTDFENAIGANGRFDVQFKLH
ncbi:hypothetical protein [Mycoplasma sp. 3686d]|uniref:hypothetical protein n=1 Tax=Mycoplasma sp. 3686d TaxID=2967300 RepID=UPI00211C99A8|nr:hypothetical protein [Mycoplasma sp. 3686d]UUM25081.1 hypothetical protein NPA12_01565 [Mycoplasma sp. 3686d]